MLVWVDIHSWRSPCMDTMGFIIDGCSFHYAHTWKKSGISICWRHLVTSKESSNPIFFSEEDLVYIIRAQREMSIHLIWKPCLDTHMLALAGHHSRTHSPLGPHSLCPDWLDLHLDSLSFPDVLRHWTRTDHNRRRDWSSAGQLCNLAGLGLAACFGRWHRQREHWIAAESSRLEIWWCSRRSFSELWDRHNLKWIDVMK